MILIITNITFLSEITNIKFLPEVKYSSPYSLP